jgi:micrococcal nuclease
MQAVSWSRKKRRIIKRKDLKLFHAIVLIAAVLLYAGSKVLFQSPGKIVKTHNDETAFVERVVDGDTLKLSDGRKVRLIGVDTPELHYSDKLLRDSRRTHKDIKEIQAMGRRAAAFIKQLCEGQSVKIEFDVRRSDKYGRILAYIYLKDGAFVNAEILKEGYAQVMTIPPNVKHSDYFLKLERSAREERKGLWAATDNM